MRNYLALVEDILENGVVHEDRTGVGRKSAHGRMLRFNLQEGFPLVTTRKVPFKSIVKELLWFISGSCDARELKAQGVGIWDAWSVTEEDIDAFLHKHARVIREDASVAKEVLKELCLGSIGFMYGRAWRSIPAEVVSPFLPDVDEEEVASDKLARWKSEYAQLQDDVPWTLYLKSRYYQEVDQLQQLIVGLKKRPHSSRHVVVSYLPQYTPIETLDAKENVLLMRGALAACHSFFQCFVSNGRLSLMLTQRSADVLVGSVFNIAQYALLTHLLAKVCGYEVGELIYSLGDAHIYLNQIEAARVQLQREPHPLAQLKMRDEVNDIYQVRCEDIWLEGYQAHEAIHYPVAV